MSDKCKKKGGHTYGPDIDKVRNSYPKEYWKCIYCGDKCTTESVHEEA